MRRLRDTSGLPVSRGVTVLSKLRVLIVEDEPLIALELEATITTIVPALVTFTASVADTKAVLHDKPFDLAFLDVDVTDGKTFELARLLSEKGVRYTFVSASQRDHLPSDLHEIPFIRKPFHHLQIERAVLAVKRPQDSSVELGREPEAD